ncbi:MAG TPA: aldehyde dehydrogenase family protein [Verrucomicrobiae bacterium]|nr:aldehyde dehydrogenase family protein [Verrucomicrobiae bacterium]
MDFSTQLFIDGELRRAKSGKVIAQINPATEEAFCEVQSAGVPELENAIEGAERTFTDSWRDLKPGSRAEILFQIARAIRENTENIAQLECRNIGKPIADARDEVQLGARVFEYYAGAISRFYGQTIPVARGGLDVTLRQPMGVVAAIVPWNFPFPIACWKAAPALAAGNCVVLKPASQSPLTAIMLGVLAHQAGLPPGALQIIPGSGSEIGDALVQHPKIRKISFTGSTAIGARIMALAAPELKRVSLELGGKSPNIVFADCDLDQAASTSPMSVFANTGQDCCARSRIFVERPIFEAFIDKFIAATRGLRVADPTRDDTQLGPLVSKSQRESVEDFISSTAGTITGGKRPSFKGYFLQPAVVVNVEPTERIWREEIFGPVACIRPFDDEKQMLAEANASPYGLSGSVWTNDLKRALRVARQVESGVLSINSHSSVHVEAPFGGFKQSGLGRDLGMSAMEGYTELKNIYFGE